MIDSRAASVMDTCANVVRGREVVGRRTFVSSMWIEGAPAWIVCTVKTRRVLVYARCAFDAATWFVDVDPARGVRLPRRKPFDVGTSARDLEREEERMVAIRATRYELIDAFYAYFRACQKDTGSRFLRVLASRR